MQARKKLPMIIQPAKTPKCAIGDKRESAIVRKANAVENEPEPKPAHAMCLEYQYPKKSTTRAGVPLSDFIVPITNSFAALSDHSPEYSREAKSIDVACTVETHEFMFGPSYVPYIKKGMDEDVGSKDIRRIKTSIGTAAAASIINCFTTFAKYILHQCFDIHIKCDWCRF